MGDGQKDETDKCWYQKKHLIVFLLITWFSTMIVLQQNLHWTVMP